MISKTVKIGDIAEQVRGVTYSKSDASANGSDGMVPILRANNITDQGLQFSNLVWVPKSCVSSKQMLRKGDIVVATSSGSLDVVGKAAPVEHDVEASFGAFCKVVRPEESADSHYLANYFKTAKYRSIISSLAAGANINNLRNEHINSLEIPLPPLAEQKRIAAILDKADAIRRKLQQSLRLSDDFLRSVFLDMFGDPVTNPKGWPVEPLSEGVESFEGGKNVNPCDIERRDAMRVLKVSAVTRGEYLEDESKSFGEDFQVPSDYIVKTGDLLISRANTAELVGAVAYVWNTSGCAMLPDKLWRFVWTKPAKINPLFMLHMARSEHFRKQLILRATGSSGSMKNIGKVKMLEIPIPLPSIALQNKFATIVTKTQSKIQKSAAFLQEAESIFSSLQQRAFRGGL